ncbi:MAG: DNA primase [Neisseria sp.]|nr:DNA primase [Neisseria sp.]
MIPSDFIDELLSKVDIVDVIDEYVPLKKGGANYMACCPFHKEKTPSFTVAPHKQFYHCFGCGANGSAIGFLMEYAHLSFPEAVEKLAARVGMQVPRSASRETPQEREAKKEHRRTLEETVEECARFYAAQLSAAPRARDYLTRRGLNAEIVERFALGYAPDGWQPLQAVFDDYPSPQLIEAGMIADKDGRQYDRFRDRIMFPIRDAKGQTIAFGGRVLDKGEPKYLNSPETPLFNKGSHLYGLYEARAGIKHAAKALVVEGYMDVVALAQHGVDYAVAALGTATTPEHVRMLLRQTDAVYFCFDGDAAGQRAAWRALENALPQLQDDKALFFLFLPPEHDPDSYIRAHGREAFERLLKNDALALSKYWLDELSRRVRLDTEEGKAELIRMAAPHLAQIPAAALKFLLTQNLAKTVGVEVSDLHYLLGQNIPPKQKSYRRAQLPAQTFRQPRPDSLAEKQIKWLLINPQWAAYVKLPEYLVLPEDCAALAELAALIRRHGGRLSTARLWEHLRGTRNEDMLQRIWRDSTRISEEFDAAAAEDEEMFRQGMVRLAGEIRARQITELSDKARIQTLTAAESELLRNLLTQR